MAPSVDMMKPAPSPAAYQPSARPMKLPTNAPATPPKPPAINTPPAQNAPAGGSTAFDPAAILNALPKRK